MAQTPGYIAAQSRKRSYKITAPRSRSRSRSPPSPRTRYNVTPKPKQLFQVVSRNDVPAFQLERDMRFLMSEAHSVTARDINTQPGAKIVFNAPYDDSHTYPIKVTNSSARSIICSFKISSTNRLRVNPGPVILEPNEATIITVTCYAFTYSQEDTFNDHITIEWTNVRYSAGRQFRGEVYQEDGLSRRMILPIEYNL